MKTYTVVTLAALLGAGTAAMAALVKPSQQPGTESCVVSGKGHCEA